MFTKETTNLNNSILGGYSIVKNDNSLISVAKKNIVVPEIIVPVPKKIILPSEATTKEKAIIKELIYSK